jgi:hypothetical protein
VPAERLVGTDVVVDVPVVLDTGGKVVSITDLVAVEVESPWDLWRLSCAPGFARSARLIAGGCVGVAKLVLDRAEHPER